MRRLLLLLLAAACAHAGEPPPFQLDWAVRYVNGEAVTMGDLREHLTDYLAGRDEPASSSERNRLMREALEDLTNERLLLNEADRLKVYIDRDLIARKVLDDARSEGQALDLAGKARRIAREERRAKRDAVLRFYEDRFARLRPMDLEDRFAQVRSTLRRPARTFVRQILLRPADPAARAEVAQQRFVLLRQAGNAADPAVQATAQRFIDAYLAGGLSPDEQNRLLDQAIAALAALDAPGARDTAVAAAAQIARQQRLRDLPAARAELERLRHGLLLEPIVSLEGAFGDLARARSEGPGAADGGRLPAVEPGTLAPEFDAMLGRLQPGELSPVFQVGGNACLVLLVRRDEERLPGFAEKSAEIETELGGARRVAVQRAVAGMLRAKAVIQPPANRPDGF